MKSYIIYQKMLISMTKDHVGHVFFSACEEKTNKTNREDKESWNNSLANETDTNTNHDHSIS